jgi:hypothetical protein
VLSVEDRKFPTLIEICDTECRKLILFNRLFIYTVTKYWSFHSFEWQLNCCTGNKFAETKWICKTLLMHCISIILKDFEGQLYPGFILRKLELHILRMLRSITCLTGGSKDVWLGVKGFLSSVYMFNVVNLSLTLQILIYS